MNHLFANSSLKFSNVTRKDLLAALFATLEGVALKMESTVRCKLCPHHLKNYCMNKEEDSHKEEMTYQFLLQFNPKSRFQQPGHIFFLLGVVFILARDILTDKGGIKSCCRSQKIQSKNLLFTCSNFSFSNAT